MKKRTLSLYLLFISLTIFSQKSNEDALMLTKIHDYSLRDGKSYEWLKVLCREAGQRIAGSPAYDEAVTVTQRLIKEIPDAITYTQDVEVEYWYRGSREVTEVYLNSGEVIKLKSLALGNSVSTGFNGIKAKVIEVKSLDEVEKLGKERITGKIVFYNRPMDVTRIRTFGAYGGAVDQRVAGASKAAQFGAIGVLVRSMTTEIDDFPHTGTLQYKENVPKIPAFAISTVAAEQLSEILKKEDAEVFMRNDAEFKGKRNSPNVIGEIRGSKYPDKVILIGGHLDSWDVAQGAHDDGAGCAQSMDVLNVLQLVGYKPNYTIRCVLFSNEENGLAGGLTYAKSVLEKKEYHVAAIESDAGGFSPRGFSFDADTSVLKKKYKKVSEQFLPFLEPYGLSFELGGSGADINPLKPGKGLLIGLRPDSQRYFDFHHTERDNIDAVHPRELKLGTAAMASLVYLIDKYGLE